MAFDAVRRLRVVRRALCAAGRERLAAAFFRAAAARRALSFSAGEMGTGAKGLVTGLVTALVARFLGGGGRRAAGFRAGAARRAASLRAGRRAAGFRAAAGLLATGLGAARLTVFFFRRAAAFA
jgi:hypothetical protein